MTFAFSQSDQLHLVVSGSNGELFSGSLDAVGTQVVCRAGRLIVTNKARWEMAAVPGAGVGRHSMAVELHAVGAHLVVKEEEHLFTLLAFVIPMSFREARWSRFERLPPTEKAMDTAGADGAEAARTESSVAPGRDGV